MGVPGSGAMPPLPDDVLTTWPSSPPASIAGTKALMPWITPQTFTSSAQRQSLSVWSHIRPSAPAPTPALLHRTWTAPWASSVASRSASTEAKSATSVTTPATSNPSSRRAATVASRTGASTSASITFMPSRAKRSPMARPMPLAPPVTTATLPARSAITVRSSPVRSSLVVVRSDRRQVVVALVGVRSDPLAGHAGDDLAPLDAAPLGKGQAHQPPHRQVGDGVEARLAQRHRPLEPGERAGRLGAVAVDEGGFAVEALAVGRGQELEVEVHAVQVVRHRQLLRHRARHLDERRAEPRDATDHPVAVALQRDLGQLLGLAERLASPDHRLLGRHRHDERVVAHLALLLRLHRERAGPEGRPPLPQVDAGHRHADQRLAGGLQRRRQHSRHDVRGGLVDGGERRRPRPDRGRLHLPVLELGGRAWPVADLRHVIPLVPSSLVSPVTRAATGPPPRRRTAGSAVRPPGCPRPAVAPPPPRPAGRCGRPPAPARRGRTRRPGRRCSTPSPPTRPGRPRRTTAAGAHGCRASSPRGGGSRCPT